MAIVLMNGEVTGVSYPAGTWQELLDVLDHESAAAGQVIIAARIGGVDVPEFRTPQALAHRLDLDAEVVIDTARPADLIAETLDEADSAARMIADAARALGRSYRAGDTSAANRALPEFAEHLGTLIVVTSTAAQGAGVDLTALATEQVSATGMIDGLIAGIEALLGAQQSGDLMRAADVVDQDIVAALQQWPLLVTAIREASPALAGAA